MTKVYPNSAAGAAAESQIPAVAAASSAPPVVLTVWRKSLLFNCSGFTVFDAEGNLAFRVDNYAGSRGEVVLMDAAGKPLLTVRRKKLSIGDQWLVYEGEEAVNPCFAVKKHVSLRRSKLLARVMPCGGGGAGKSECCSSAYEIEGSYAQRSCAVYGGEGRREVVADVRRKEAVSKGVGFGADVFRLVVQSRVDVAVVMGMVVVMEQMFGSR